jgi:hypothetical protein
MSDRLDEHDERSVERRSEWISDPMTNYPVGPDDAGNVVMHGISFLVSGWHWLVGRFERP